LGQGIPKTIPNISRFISLFFQKYPQKFRRIIKEFSPDQQKFSTSVSKSKSHKSSRQQQQQPNQHQTAIFSQCRQKKRRARMPYKAPDFRSE
jgi:hypothetical protein